VSSAKVEGGPGEVREDVVQVDLGPAVEVALAHRDQPVDRFRVSGAGRAGAEPSRGYRVRQPRRHPATLLRPPSTVERFPAEQPIDLG
jgi:hypothetical protein